MIWGVTPTCHCCLAGEALRRPRGERENPAMPVIALLNADLSEYGDLSLRLAVFVFDIFLLLQRTHFLTRDLSTRQVCGQQRVLHLTM
jgi:hypothetical protein